MAIRFATPDEIARWDELILNNPDGGNVFASEKFLQQKLMNGYKIRYVMVGSLAVSVLEKVTPPLGKLWYLPKGPGVTSSKELFIVLKEVTPFAKKRGVFVVRTEPELLRAQESTLSRHGMVKAASIIPNSSTITLDISQDLDTVLSRLPQKGRHAIRRAERDGVTIERVNANEKNCRIMYKLLSETAEGQFGIRSYNYYKTFWQRFALDGSGQLFFAFYKKQPVAGAYAMVFGKKSTYKDGASVRDRTAYGASHLLQWEVITWAKQHGSLLHDLCGAPPSDQANDTSHPHYGIGKFKTAFNKTITDYVGCYDRVIRPVRYKLWTKAGERIYRHYYYKRTHDYYY